MSSDELLQQLQPLLLVEELSKHKTQSIGKQKYLKELLLSSSESNTTSIIDGFMKEEHDYYSKKSKELKLLCNNFIARQSRLILQGTSLKQQLNEHISNNGGSITQKDDGFPTEFIFEQQSQHVIQVCALLTQEITLTITIIKTIWDSILQLVKCFEFVITHSLQSKLSELDNLSKHLSILLKELERFSVSFQSPVHSDFDLDLMDGNSSAVLVFSRQPFPGMIKRHKQMQPDELIIDMLTTSNFPYTYSKLKVHSSAITIQNTGLNSTLINTNTTTSLSPTQQLQINNSNNNNNNDILPNTIIPKTNDNNNNNNNNNNIDNNNSNTTTPPQLQSQKSDLFESHTFDLFPSDSQTNKYSGKIPLKFVKGTTQFSSLKFSISLIHKVTKEQFTIETDFSERFIVFANDSQWVDHFCQLLKDEIFLYQDPNVPLLSINNYNSQSSSSQIENIEPYLFNQVTHHRVIKTLQKFFPICLNIRKSLVHQYQPLPNEPIESLLNQISENKITNNEFDSFISILSPAFKVIKYQKNAIDLWNLGVIFLFITNEKAKQLLLSSSQNDDDSLSVRFLLQFSSIHPFCWVIKYLDFEKEIKEIYIDMKVDLQGDRNSKSILSFIENSLISNLKEICQYDQKSNVVRFIPKSEIRSLLSFN